MDRRGRRPARATSGLVCAALLIAGCAGSDGDAEPPSTAAPPDTAAAAAVEDQPVAEPVDLDTLDDTLDLDTLDLETLDPADVTVVDVEAELDLSEMDQVAARTRVLVERMGSDGAFDALVYALARGYPLDAIGSAIADDRLGGDGTIDGETPTLATSTLLQLPSPAQGLRAPRVRGHKSR